MKYVGIQPSAAARVLYSRSHLAAKGMGQKVFCRIPGDLKIVYKVEIVHLDVRQSKMLMISLTWQKQFGT